MFLTTNTAQPREEKLEYSLTNEGVSATLRIRGTIGVFSEEDFEMQVNSLIAAGVKNLHIDINSHGGSVFSANSIYNIIQKFPGEVSASIGALCASAATLILLAADEDKRTGSKNSFIMIHPPSGCLCGGVEEMESYIQLMRKTEQQIKAVYLERTKMDKDKMKEIWGKDHWMNAEDALSLGFISTVGDAKKMDKEELEALTNACPDIPASILNSLQAAVKDEEKPEATITTKTPLKNENIMDKKELIKTLGLAENATDQDIMNAIKQQKEGKDQEQLIAALIALGESKGVINETNKERYQALAKADFSNTLAIINEAKATATEGKEEGEPEKREKPEALSVADLISAMQKNGGASKDEDPRANWSYKDWQEKDPKALEQLRVKSPEKVEKLLEAHYGRKVKL
jgi:ATP-dependent Clp protease, protease subunit